LIAVDSSVLIAIVKREPERAQFLSVLSAADGIIVSAVTVVEARMVAHHRGGAPMLKEIDSLLAAVAVEIIAPDAEAIELAHAAFVTYGRGSGHPARLNFGDLFSYALARSRDVPLLCKGQDFARTDLKSATEL
jgi:ribonuclease VapC